MSLYLSIGIILIYIKIIKKLSKKQKFHRDDHWPPLRDLPWVPQGLLSSAPAGWQVPAPSQRGLSASADWGSDPTAAGGGEREGSEWQRSARNEPASSGEVSAGHRNRRVTYLRNHTPSDLTSFGHLPLRGRQGCGEGTKEREGFDPPFFRFCCVCVFSCGSEIGWSAGS